MGDFPVPPWPPLNVVSPWHPESLGGASNAPSVGMLPLSSVASTVFVANRVFYYPFRVFQPALAVKLGYVVGTVANGNVDLGIYDSQKNKIVSSGSTAQGSTSAIQELDTTNTMLLPGFTYWMAITGSSGTGTSYAISPADELMVPMAAMMIEDTVSFGLPTTAAWAPSTIATPSIYAMGVWFDTLL